MNHKSFRLASFKALDQTQGIFEAIVAVFGNVDRGGDKILPGAFAKSLAGWEQRGRPIPVIFSHEWANLDAHIGEVLEAKEINAGLYVKGQLEMDEPFAQRVWKKMNKGTLAEFSFAYDVIDAVQAKMDGVFVNELRELELLEVGPCLVGMNPDTQLLMVKTEDEILRAAALRMTDGKEGRRNAAKDAERIQTVHDLVCALGAKCEAKVEAEAAGESKPDGKAKGPRPETLAARVALELLEAGY